jgi:deoxycytidylate deaminase
MTSVANEREKDQFYLTIADAVETGADCLGSDVGAVAVLGHRVLGTGYNGTPSGYRNCKDGGCGRCLRRDAQVAVSGTDYDVCLCVHAEQNLMSTAARFGVQLEGAALYTTLQPCFQCLKELIQVGFCRVVYVRPWLREKEERSWVPEDYDQLVGWFKSSGRRFEQMPLDDLELSARAATRETVRRADKAQLAQKLKARTQHVG